MRSGALLARRGALAKGAAAAPAENYPTAVLADTPLAFYRMNEPSGNVLTDSSGNVLHGTIPTNTTRPTLGVSGGLSGIPAETAMSFDGANDVVQMPSGVSLSAGSPMTVEYLIYVASADSGQTGSAFTIGNPSAVGDRCQAHSPYSGTFYFDYPDFNSGRVSVSFAGFYDQWVHVALTSNGSNDRRIFFNGAQKAQTTASASSTTTLTGGFIGGWPGSSLWEKALIGEFAVYTHVVSPTRIAAHQAARANP